ncbi:MAG: imidazole glycerol phosphate synthase subunit HisH [Clostridia bacterium]|nr:imidazole glycerol phosphate synthase subunit HisH [Clostridia bacterium]
MIAIIDYGAGNLRSVQKACEMVGGRAEITSNPEIILNADHIILPGVGAFGDCMHNLNSTGLSQIVHEAIESGKPFLGICLGMQLLFDSSEETLGVDGLGIFPGKIVKIPKQEGFKIPHMGWNSLKFSKNSPIFHGIGEEPFVYFVHSYYACPDDLSIVSATTDYCGNLSVAISHNNVFATQFHPEKSGNTGLKILKNFVEIGGNK